MSYLLDFGFGPNSPPKASSLGITRNHSSVLLQQEEPCSAIAILQSPVFNNFEPFDSSVPSILTCYTLCAELWNYLMIYESIHQIWIVMLCLYISSLVQSSVCLQSILIYYLAFFMTELEGWIFNIHVPFAFQFWLSSLPRKVGSSSSSLVLW